MINGNTVDCAIMHQTLASCASMTTEWAVPWRPHCLVTYALELEDDFRLYHQLRTFPPLPNVPDIGFRAWSTYVTQVEDPALCDSTENQSARGLADWVSVTEQYLLQQRPWAQGRASNLTTQYQPLVPAKSGGMWKKGKAGKASSHYHSSPGKALQSPWMPLHPHMTNAPRHGSSPFAYIPSPWEL